MTASAVCERCDGRGEIKHEMYRELSSSEYWTTGSAPPHDRVTMACSCQTGLGREEERFRAVCLQHELDHVVAERWMLRAKMVGIYLELKDDDIRWAAKRRLECPKHPVSNAYWSAMTMELSRSIEWFEKPIKAEMSKEPITACPRCDGSGQVEHFVVRLWANISRYDSPGARVQVPCSCRSGMSRDDERAHAQLLAEESWAKHDERAASKKPE